MTLQPRPSFFSKLISEPESAELKLQPHIYIYVHAVAYRYFGFTMMRKQGNFDNDLLELRVFQQTNTLHMKFLIKLR